MREVILDTGSVKICAESFGNPNNPAILLIMGATASMIWWDSGFCKLLSEAGYYVIRFDNRDTGRSTCYEPGKPEYNLIDMTNDAIAVMDAYKIQSAHFIGMSLGGMLAQICALKNKDRVLSLTLIASSVFAEISDLPPISQKILDYHSSASNLNWTDKDSAINFMVGGWELLCGSAHSFDRDSAYRLAEEEYSRAGNLRSMFNHALLKGGEQYYENIQNIEIPTLIIHGTEDPVLPYKHAVALNETISTSQLVTLIGRGHEIHKKDWKLFINAIDTFISNYKNEAENSEVDTSA